jgi:serine/threonine protein kinase
MSLQLVVTEGPDKDRRFILHAGPDLMLGRSKDAYYTVNDPQVSRNHCQVLREGDRITIICNGGYGGTLINGKKIEREVLKPGDILQVGDTKLRLQTDDMPPAAAAAPGPAAAAPVEQLETLSGHKLSHYDVGPVIGKGTSGMVFQATDTKSHQSVALKVLLPELSKQPEAVQRFIRAMQTVLPLRHHHLVTVSGAGKTGPYCWVAMEYIAGENMAQVIARIGASGMLDWRFAFQVAVHVARALKFAHNNHIVHRNVTPTNILRDASAKIVKLGDLMLAKVVEAARAEQRTKPGELLGDVSYMSPERTRGTTDLDGRSDLYGLGATLYALLTGRPPFGGKTVVEKITRIRQTEPEKPTKFHTAIPPRFEAVVMKLLAKRPELRYQSADALLAELEQIGKLHGVTA